MSVLNNIGASMLGAVGAAIGLLWMLFAAIFRRVRWTKVASLVFGQSRRM